MNSSENPVDFRDRHEVEGYITFAIVCVCAFGFLANLINILALWAATY